MEPRRFGSRRRREPLRFGTQWGFLQPPRRPAVDEDAFRARLRSDPAMNRQYRSALLVQLTLVGILFLACLTLVVQAVVMVRRIALPGGSPGWVIPLGVGFLALLVLRRFLRLLSEYRDFDSD